MKKIISLIIITLILFSSLTPALAANEKITKEPVNQDKIVHDMTKESFKKLDNNIEVREKDVSKYTVTKDKRTISISKHESTEETTKTTLKIHKKEIEKLEGFDGQYVGVTHISNDGTTTHGVLDISQYLNGQYYEIPAEMSETIYDGFSGMYNIFVQGLSILESTNYTISSGTVENATITFTINGTIPESISYEDVGL